MSERGPGMVNRDIQPGEFMGSQPCPLGIKVPGPRLAPHSYG